MPMTLIQVLPMAIVSEYGVGATSHPDSNFLTLDARVAMHGKISKPD
jgi:hypothetical protein